MRHLDILFLVRSLNVGGAERQLVLLARTLHQRGIRVGVAQFYGGGVFADELLQSGVPLYDLRKRGRWSNLGFAWRLWRLLRRLRPKVAHGYLSTPNLILLLMKPFLRSQNTFLVSGVRSSEVDISMYDTGTAVLDWIYRRALMFSDAVICNSEAGLRHISKYLSSTSIHHVIDNGIDTDKFVFDENARREFRKCWDTTPSQTLVGLVGRHDPVKGHALFLSVAAKIAARVPEARFVLIGKEAPSITPNLKIQAESLGIAERIIWAGHQSDLSAVYSAIDVLCLCSQSEGFPNVVAEAMSCGLPCVCTDVGDVRRVVADAGWVEKRDSVALCLALEQAIAILPVWDRKRPRLRIAGYFSVDKLADRTLAALDPFLAQCQKS
jgi:glycosyltransferase involved in cell wall biosynthesis